MIAAVPACLPSRGFHGPWVMQPRHAWYKPESVTVGYEISFTRYFYRPQPLRTLEEIRTDILELQQETEGLLDEIIGSESR